MIFSDRQPTARPQRREDPAVACAVRGRAKEAEEGMTIHPLLSCPKAGGIFLFSAKPAFRLVETEGGARETSRAFPFRATADGAGLPHGFGGHVRLTVANDRQRWAPVDALKEGNMDQLDFGSDEDVLRFIQEKSDDIEKAVIFCHDELAYSPQPGAAPIKISTKNIGIVLWTSGQQQLFLTKPQATLILNDGILNRMRIEIEVQ